MSKKNEVRKEKEKGTSEWEKIKFTLSMSRIIKGRISPKQAWKTGIFVLISTFVFMITVIIIFNDIIKESFIIYAIATYYLAILSLSIPIRRLHDMGYSGWWFLLIIIIIGNFATSFPLIIKTQSNNSFDVWFIMLYFLLYSIPGNKERNKYGLPFDDEIRAEIQNRKHRMKLDTPDDKGKNSLLYDGTENDKKTKIQLKKEDKSKGKRLYSR